MRELKKTSPLLVHEAIGLRSFGWQKGYAASIVSVTARESVRHYIAAQEEHHRVSPFRDELAEMLNKAEIQYSLEYLD